jgi:hypothetical protein
MILTGVSILLNIYITRERLKNQFTSSELMLPVPALFYTDVTVS